MRSRSTRVLLALSVIALTQGCAALQNARVAPLRPENSSASRSMLSQFNPVPSQHYDVDDQPLLRGPEDRGRGPLSLGQRP